MRRGTRMLESLAVLLMIVAIVLVVLEIRQPEADRGSGQPTRTTSARALLENPASAPRSGVRLDRPAHYSHSLRKEHPARTQAGFMTPADESSAAANRTGRSPRGEASDGRNAPVVSVEDPLLGEVGTKADSSRTRFRLPLFYTLDNEKIAAKIPGVTVAGLKILKEEFEEQAGVGVLSVDDPLYAEHWKQAELTLQQRIRLWYGWAAWGAFEHQAALQASARNVVPSAP